jgi:DNA-binding transcriptional LysR family regulator
MKGFHGWRGVELRHFAALQAIGEEGSFGAAAERLGYTQSAVSHQVAALERAVGARLVERPGGPRRVALTDAGRLLMAHADAIVARIGAAQADLDALSEGTAGVLRVGTYQSAGARILPPVVRRFTESWPGVEVRLREASYDVELFDLVERGELDLTFMAFPIADGPFAVAELLIDPMVLVVARDSPLAGATAPVPLRQIASLPLIAHRASGPRPGTDNAWERHLRARGHEPRVVFRSDDNPTIHGLVAAGLGAALIPRLSTDPAYTAVATVPVAGTIPPRVIGVAWHRDRQQLPAARAFVDMTQEFCAAQDWDRPAAA